MMKQLSMRIPFRALPIEGELFKAYTVRLASLNHRENLSDFVSAFGLPGNSTKIFMRGTPENEKFMRILSLSLGYEVGSLDKYFETEGVRQMRKWLSSHQTLMSNPTICPTCVENEKYLKADWHLYYASHCLEHNCKLWRDCPQCGNKFKWQGKVFDGCTSCGLQWKNVCAVKVFSPPLSQVAIAESTDTDKDNLVNRITSKMNISLRPFDASFQRNREIDEHVPDLASYIETAYRLGHSKSAIKELKKLRLEYWQSKIGGAPQAKLMQKVDAANDEHFFDLDETRKVPSQKPLTLKEASYQILTSHRRLNTTAEKACFELSWNQLERVLLMKEPHLKKLIREGTIPGRMHINSPGKVSPSRLDDIVGFFRQIKNKSLPLPAANDDNFEQDFIAWGEDERLSDFKLKTRDLVKRLKSGELKVYSPDYHDHGFENFHFRRTSIANLYGAPAANDSHHAKHRTRSA